MRSFLAWASVFFILAVAVGHAALTRHRRDSHVRASLASSPAQMVSVNCTSPSLGGMLPALVYLPAGYATTATRYPVIYVLHGLPAGPQTYTESGFVAAAVASGPLSAIVVAPQGAREPDSDPEYLREDATDNWPQAIARDLTRCIDSQFRTIADRAGRALIGFSAGGFGAMNIGLRNLRTYGAVESWSGYFEATDPSGRHLLNLGSPAANAAARVPRGATLARGLRRHPTYIAFYIGNQDGYRNFLADNRAFSAALRAVGIRHRFAVYPGTHSVSLWEQHAAGWLDQALAFLARLRAR